jgi:hypothetical protein
MAHGDAITAATSLAPAGAPCDPRMETTLIYTNFFEDFRPRIYASILEDPTV